MKVLFILPNYEPAWAFGGVVRCMSSLCRALAKSGADVSVYTTDADGCGGLLPVTLEEPTDVGGVKVTYFSTTFGRNSTWDSRALLRKLRLSITDFDILYVAATWQWLGVSARRLAKKWGVPYVIGTHGSLDSISLRNSRLKKLIYWHMFLKKCFRNASGIHFTTGYERCNSVLISGHSNFIVPNCLDPEAFQSNDALGTVMRDKFRILPDAGVLIAVGRPDTNKNLALLLQCLPVVLKHFPNIYLLLVGEDNNNYALKMKKLSIELKISGNVIWTGFRTGDELKGCYSAADIFLLPSIGENFGMAVAEAMAAGLPVVVSDRVGVAEDIKNHNAGIVTNLNIQQIAEAVIDLLSNRDRLNMMSKSAIKAALQLYSCESIAQLMIKAFEDILSNSQSPECRWQ